MNKRFLFASFTFDFFFSFVEAIRCVLLWCFVRHACFFYFCFLVFLRAWEYTEKKNREKNVEKTKEILLQAVLAALEQVKKDNNGKGESSEEERKEKKSK